MDMSAQGVNFIREIAQLFQSFFFDCGGLGLLGNRLAASDASHRRAVWRDRFSAPANNPQGISSLRATELGIWLAVEPY
jgi:hypothetical protein